MGNGSRVPARLLAVLAVGLCAGAILLIVVTSLGGSSGGGSSTTSNASSCNPKADAAVKAGYFVVNDPEDVFAVIAERTCINVDDLYTLNPDLDANALPLGSCVNLEPKGCNKYAP